jgi:hypothetical protein
VEKFFNIQFHTPFLRDLAFLPVTGAEEREEGGKGSIYALCVSSTLFFYFRCNPHVLAIAVHFSFFLGENTSLSSAER